MSGHSFAVCFRLAPLAIAAVLLAAPAYAAGERHFSFGYDQPHTTGYGIAADIFAAKLGELSKGKLSIDQFPGAQLGQEPQMLQKIRTGDIDFIIILDCERLDRVAAIGRLFPPLHFHVG